MSKDDFKTRILRSTVIAGFAATGLAMSPAFAQDDTDESTDEQDVVVVTGSRIARDEFSSSSPVQVITREEATIAGLTGLDDILQDSTIAMVQPRSTTSSPVSSPMAVRARIRSRCAAWAPRAPWSCSMAAD